MHNPPLERIRVAAPCSAEWRWMYGNERVRFCGQCSLNVYNLSAMTREQAEDLIRRTEGHLCVRFYRRADGSILTQNCPTGVRRLKERFIKTRAAIVTALLTFFGSLTFLRRAYSQDSDEGVFPVTIASKTFASHVNQGMMVLGATSQVSFPPIRRSERFIRKRAILEVSRGPHPAAGARSMGNAVVRIIIAEDGTVDTAELVRGNPRLKDLAEDAASRWKFQPISYRGQPATAESYLTLRF